MIDYDVCNGSSLVGGRHAVILAIPGLEQSHQRSSVHGTPERCQGAWKRAGQSFHFPQPSPQPFDWLSLHSVPGLPAATLHTRYMHTYLCTHQPPLLLLLSKESQTTTHSPACCAQVTSQASISPSSPSSFPPPERGPTPSDQFLQVVLKTVLENAVIKTPTWHQLWFSSLALPVS